ncbi:plexin-B2 [Protopterus annectens]|uniref:plexin-B2 n=1 Tax=Protopterus annectens TaxID=7888 RepID=UPI001CF99184|nr:plexin-B2 [Protopterus annectens]
MNSSWPGGLSWLQFPFPCGDEHLPFPLGSLEGVNMPPVKQYAKSITAVAVANENGHTVVFLGTSNGEVIKIFMRDGAEEYGTVQVWSNSVRGELVFSAKEEHLYVLSTNKVTYIPVQTCNDYKDCQSCMKSRDPYCGWCVTEGECKRKSTCSRAEEKNHWLWSFSNECVSIVGVDPEFLSIEEDHPKVLFTTNLFPDVSDDDKVLCKFGDDKRQLEPDAYNNTHVSCLPPRSAKIPPTTGSEDYVLVPVELFLQTPSHSIMVTSANYTFYNCSAAMSLFENTPCISCVGSKWKCQWNQKDHRCVQPTSSDENSIQAEENCPQFFNTTPLTPLSVEHESRINFEGKNLGLYEGKSFIVGNKDMDFRASLKTEGDTYYFTTEKFSLSSSESVPLLFYIEEGESKNKIDSVLNVTLYNCSYGRNDCSKCLAANAEYQCVWCDVAGHQVCVFTESCKTKKYDDCPTPTITKITPNSGPLGGGIFVTISGYNLGRKADDIKNITIANIPCEFERKLYSVSDRIVCKTGNTNATTKGGVRVTINPEKTGFSDVMFEYREPKVHEIHPNKGIRDGGTNITISGTHLNTASMDDVSVSLGGVNCSIIHFGDEIICVTGKMNDSLKEGGYSFKIQYGNSIIETDIKFTYKPSPVIRSINPNGSFASGGRNITVTGEGFSAVSHSFMEVHTTPNSHRRRRKKRSLTSVVKTAAVRMDGDSTVIFSSPTIAHNPYESRIRVYVIMDGFSEDIPSEGNAYIFIYHPDPVFESYNESNIQGNTVITVKGSGLISAMTAEEAEVYVGDKRCSKQTLTDTNLFCELSVQDIEALSSTKDTPLFKVKFGNRIWVLGKVMFASPVPLNVILPLIIIPMVAIIFIAVICYRRKSQQAEREYEKIKSQLEGLEESVRDRCKKEFTDLMIEMEDQTNDVNEAGIPFLNYKTYTDRVFFLPSKDGENDVMITGKIDIPESRRQAVENALNQFSNLLNSKLFLTNFIHTLEGQKEFSAREKVYFASLLTVALHGKLEYYTDIMRTLFLELMEQYVAKNPKLMLRRSETVVERMLANWMSICLYSFLKDSAGEPLYRLFKAIKHQVEKGPVDAVQKKAKYTLNDTGLLGDDVEYSTLTVNVFIQGDVAEVTPVKVLNCDTVSQVKEKIIDQVYRNVPFSQRPKSETVALEWRPGSTGQILSDLDLTSITEGRSKRLNTLKHYNVQDGTTLVLTKAVLTQQQEDHQQDIYSEKNALLEDDSKTWHLVRPADEVDESKSKRGSLKEKERTKAITEIYLTRLLSVKGTLQNFVDDFFQSVLSSNQVVPPAVKYFFDFLDEQAEKHGIIDEDTIHIWKTNSLPLRFWVNILKNPHFIFDVHVHEVVDASLSVIAQTFMDACTRTEHKLSRDSPSNKLLYAKEISAYKKMVEDYYRGIRQMVQVSDQDMNTHLAEVSRAHTESLNTLVSLYQLYQYASKYYDAIINALEGDPASQKMQLAFRLQQIAAAVEDKVTDL